MKAIYAIALIAIGIMIGVGAARFWPHQSEPAEAPEEWLARVGAEYITPEEFVFEMERRGGRRPGQFGSVEQRRTLLNSMVVREALVDAAREASFDQRPEVRRSMDSVLVTKYQQARLEPLREDVEVTDEEIEGYYRENAEDYTVPARKRVAQIFIAAGANAPPEARERARQRAEEIREEALQLDEDVVHFGELARRHSDDQASRYRGGVIGWVSEDAARSRFGPAIHKAAERLDDIGEISPVIEGEDGFRVVRLVQLESSRERALEDLRSGIRQRLLGEKLRAVEAQFLDRQMAEREIEINTEGLADIEPLSGPQRPDGPPAGPSDRENNQ